MVECIADERSRDGLVKGGAFGGIALQTSERDQTRSDPEAGARLPAPQAGGGRGRGGWRLGVSRGTGSERTEGVSSVLKNSIKFVGVTLVNKVM